jgi:IS5 family transposase
LGEEQLVALFQESLAVAHKTGALAVRDLERVVVDTTVQPKAIAYPTDARLCHRALEKLVDLAKRNNVPLRQSYLRVAKRAAIMVGRYTHAHQFKRARPQISAHPAGPGDPRHWPQDRWQRDARGTASPSCWGWRCGCVSRITGSVAPRACPRAVTRGSTPCTLPRSNALEKAKLGRRTSLKALHGNPFDGHTLGPVIAELEALTGVEIRRIHVDKGYCGHNHRHKFRVWITGHSLPRTRSGVRRVTRPIRREMKRRAVVEPVIGHIKAEHRMGRNHLKGRDGDCANAVLAAAGYNFALLLRWLQRLLRALIQALLASAFCLNIPKITAKTVLHGRL